MTLSSTSPAVGHALDILTFLSKRVGSVPAAVIIRELGLPRSSAYHILTLLVEKGYALYLAESRGYALGPAGYRLASPYAIHEPVERLARPVLRKLADQHAITVHLGILRGPNTVYLLKESPARGGEEPNLVTAVGVLLPAHLTANGRAVLSHMVPSQVAALYPRASDFVSRTGRGPRSQAELARELKIERDQGYSEETELIEKGLRSAGVAIFDLHNQPIAALSATWRLRIMARDHLEVVRFLREGADKITARLRGDAVPPST
ncbi:IclR family transcriptional regulator [Propionicicella superfundia]|uniref:IclR family transcriptional regulator n=1 Tax=Propionicicella superfundia TaxID=348582 RepID=UPI00040241EC|nr:IclR family transcriptional regulator [Propionicicella superfundia]